MQLQALAIIHRAQKLLAVLLLLKGHAGTQ
jgi:hypothetical protein